MVTELTPVTGRTKDYIWDAMFDVARYVQYYGMQMNRLSKANKALRAALLLGSALAVASAFDVLPMWVGACGALSILFLTIADFVWEPGTRAALSHAINLECYVIAQDYESLWIRVETGRIDEGEAQGRVKELNMRVAAATAQLSETDNRLNRKAKNTAARVLAERWGGNR